MERKIISHRIGSILDDISRLSNALYAMDTTDIQRYPDNYEVLSTDAALRAEKIACCVPITGINCAATVWGREPKPLCWKAGRTGLPAT